MDQSHHITIGNDQFSYMTWTFSISSNGPHHIGIWWRPPVSCARLLSRKKGPLSGPPEAAVIRYQILPGNHLNYSSLVNPGQMRSIILLKYICAPFLWWRHALGSWLCSWQMQLTAFTTYPTVSQRSMNSKHAAWLNSRSTMKVANTSGCIRARITRNKNHGLSRVLHWHGWI